MFGGDLVAAQHPVNGVGDVGVDGYFGPALDFYQNVKSRRRAAFQDGLLGAASPRLYVAERYGLDAAYEVG